MSGNYDPQPLCAAYDRGQLVPFIGSGMSVPACVGWETFLSNLEKQCFGNNFRSMPGMDTVQRAFVAMQSVKLHADSMAAVAKVIEQAVYSNTNSDVPKQTQTLANLVWPLVCTTNYDDIYLRAKYQIYQIYQRREPREQLRVLGRSDVDCRRVLQHLSFPTNEVLWALQGFLQPRDKFLNDILDQDAPPSRLESELVVGHEEYRRVANREPHFRRCFAEMFRRSSLLFLGSGLVEYYFLSLFDEIIELTGPPSRPHFAFIEAGKVDTEIMRRRYHILCITYPAGKHEYVTCYLEEFRSFVRGKRVRPSAWGFRVRSPNYIKGKHTGDNFRVVRAVLPGSHELHPGEAVAISCGRGEVQERRAPEEEARRGEPLVNQRIAKDIGLCGAEFCNHQWLNDWVVQWKNLGEVFGIVARELIEPVAPLDLRSSDVTRVAFLESLKEFEKRGIKVLHVQLLASGPGRVFHQWISLVQMAKAYGQWFRQRQNTHGNEPLCVVLHIVDPAIIILLHGGFVDLAEHLEDTPLRIAVEVIYPDGSIEQYHKFVCGHGKIQGLTAGLPKPKGEQFPKALALPTPRRDFQKLPLASIENIEVQKFGLVSGSTLVLDYRQNTNRSWPMACFRQIGPFILRKFSELFAKRTNFG